MKNQFLAAVIFFAASIQNTTQARDAEKVNYRVQQSFYEEFGSIDQVTWKETSSGMMKACFKQADQSVCAFFTRDGEYLATTTIMKYNQLPEKLRVNLDKTLLGMTVIEVFELRNDYESAFYISAKKGNTERLLKGFANGYANDYVQGKSH